MVFFISPAKVAELVDAQASGACRYILCGFESHLSHHVIIKVHRANPMNFFYDCLLLLSFHFLLVIFYSIKDMVCFD